VYLWALRGEILINKFTTEDTEVHRAEFFIGSLSDTALENTA
jgi:hypothetical protein